MSRLYIIGNGFDLLHKLPTRFEPDFKLIAENNEINPNFWGLYTQCGDEIWSDFEHSLAKPDFNSLLEIFDNYYPHYLSDHESDRDDIISVAEYSGQLEKSLLEFALAAEEKLKNTEIHCELMQEFLEDDLFINSNYTHTLEELYKINEERILHIHGEVGKSDLILGYPEGEYSPEKFCIDVRGKGRGPYREIEFEQYLEEKSIDVDSANYYVDTAYSTLLEITKSYFKSQRIDLLENFLEKERIDEIVIKGHSCAIDYPYFEWLNVKFSNAQWNFSPFDEIAQNNIMELVAKYNIKNWEIHDEEV